jgi:hypothetical protein
VRPYSRYEGRGRRRDSPLFDLCVRGVKPAWLIFTLGMAMWLAITGSPWALVFMMFALLGCF